MFINYVKKNWYIFSLFSILIVAVFIRFYNLGLVPHGMTWDEAAIGYNGYAVFNTRRDEWLNRLPISFMSFGDFKAPFAIYLNGFFTYVFGLNLFAVRLPFAIISILTILGIILFTEEIFKDNRYKNYYSLFSGILMTLSPWHIHYSRTGFESGIALGFITWAIFFLVKYINNGFKGQKLIIFSALLFVLSIYTYHSAKIFVPFLGVTFLFLNFKEIKANYKKLLLPLVLFVVGLIPFIYDSVAGEGLTRAGVTIFSSDISFVNKILYVFKSLLIHFSPDFLLAGKTTTFRHGTGYLGVVFITTFFLLVAGFISFLKNLKNLNKQFLAILIIILGILPAAVSLEIPHSNRAILALPGIILTAIFGLDFLISVLSKTKSNISISGSHNEKNIIVKSFVGSLLVVHIVFSVKFINYYFADFSSISTVDFNDGYLEAFELAEKYEKGENTKAVDKIIFTSKYGQPYIYALFARETNPIWYRGGSLVKYEFKENVNVGDLMRSNALIVGSKDDDLPTSQADHIIYGSDGSIRFQIFRTN